MFVTQGDLQGQKVNLKVEFQKILFLTNTNSSVSDFERRMHLSIILVIQHEKVNSQD